MSGPVSIVVPTLGRPQSLERALRSLLAQQGFERLVREIVVVDNAPDASARQVVHAVAAAATRPVLYVHEPHPGVATARNTGLSVAVGELIAFLDDDEEAPPHWLNALLDAHRRFGADVTFGAIRGCVPEGTGWARAYLERLFSRFGPADSGLTELYWGCGNSLMTRSSALAGPAPFDPARDQTGGEDDTLFRRLREQGRRFAWSREAWVWEHAPAERATLRYALRRAFAYGQSPCQGAAERGDFLALLFWMGVGAGQTVVYGASAAALWLLRRPARAELYDRTARGLGKLFWMDRFVPRFYGRAALSP
jgi:succinoglycan biosynthesis protein ExoM